jgi:Multiubiquitin
MEDKMSEEQKKHEGEAEKIAALEEAILEELIDLEEWVKAKKGPHKAKRYRIRIDKDKFVVTVHEMTGKEILALVAKTPDKYLLSQKFHGGRVEPVKPDQVVEFHRCEIERFQTLAKDPTEG